MITDSIRINEKSLTLESRFTTPDNYVRTLIPQNSFGEYLRTIKLKPHGSSVHYYNGTIKPNIDIYTAVIDLDIGTKDLHQCADAIMRLRGEYLWKNKKYDNIHFNFTNGYKVEYTEWMKGRRMILDNNKTYWNDRLKPSNTYEDFWKYMELIFTYAGTASLEKELISIPYHEMEIGDILIQGGFPGHAVIVMDKAQHTESGKKIFLLAQSYMPAQDLQILENPNHPSFSPWYELGKESILTPEWTFQKSNLMRFR